MREIKFRAWDKENEQFIQFNKMGFLEDGSLWYVQGVDENERETDPPYFENQNDWELMQYTGLKDKNGVDIYEGDVLTLKYPRDRRYTVTAKVIRGTQISAMVLKFEDGFTTEEIPLYKISAEHNLEVIGNIYENQELLESEAEWK